MGNQASCFKSKGRLLHEALVAGDVKTVTEVLQTRPGLLQLPLCVARASRYNPLETAIVYGQLGALEAVYGLFLKEHGHEATTEMLDTASRILGISPLMLACQSGSASCLKFIISKGADSMAIVGATGQTGLHLASMAGSACCVDALLNHHQASSTAGAILADPWGQSKFADLRTLRGVSALHLASARGDVSVVEALLRGGVLLDVTVEDSFALVPWCGRGSTALHLSASLGHERVSELLVAAQPYHLGVDLLRIRNQQGLQAAQCAQLSHRHRLAVQLTPPPSTMHEMAGNRLQQYTRFIADALAASRQGEEISLRVNLLLGLWGDRTVQIARERAAAEDGGSCRDRAINSCADAVAAEPATAPARRSSGNRDLSLGQAESGAALQAFEDASAVQAVMMSDRASARSLSERIEMDTLGRALLVVESASLSGLMTSWLESLDMDPGALPPDWQLQIASLSLNCAANLAECPPSTATIQMSQRTAVILLQLGGKIMMHHLWPPGPAASSAVSPSESQPLEGTAEGGTPETATGPSDEGKPDGCPNSSIVAEDNQCAICMSDDRCCDTEIRPCGHLLCMPCAFEIAYTSPTAHPLTCPFCRVEVSGLAALPMDMLSQPDGEVGECKSLPPTDNDQPKLIHAQEPVLQKADEL